ncbi:MAG: transposase [Deltaproteobacteria bacterium]|nr:transposase [Deltaproteobacteria bacterium]
MIKTYKYRLEPTRKQEEKLDQMLETCRILYNSCLVDRNRHYKETGKGLSRIDQQKLLVRDKKNIEELTNTHSQVLQDVLFRVEKAYKAFFRRLKDRNGKAGYPRFKNYGRYDSITYTQSGFSIAFGKLKLSKVGHIKLKQHRNINGIIKTCNIKKEIDKYYVCFSVEYKPEPKPISNRRIGIDMGIKSFAVLSNGETLDNPKYLVKSEEKLNKKQKRLSPKKKGSNNRKKARIVVAKLHKKVSNQRKDFQHKQSRRLVDNYGYIAVEDLQIRNMVKNHNLAKSIHDAGWGAVRFFPNIQSGRGWLLCRESKSPQYV